MARIEGAIFPLSGEEAAIAAERLERRFGAVRALRGLDLEVACGETLAVFGANGAGKTTLLRILAGLLHPNAGTVRLFGRELPGDAALRRRIGVVGHESFIYGDLSGAENLSYYARLYRVDAARGAQLLAEVGLREAAHRPARTYSRGMMQRLSLARAILHEPELLLLDEPFTGLDALGANVLTAVFTRLRTAGATIVLTTHDFERGLEVATRAVVLDRGRIAWSADGALPDPSAMREVCARIAAGA